MSPYKLSIIGLDKDKSAIATGRDLRISPKHAREVCKELKGLFLEPAKEYLEEVIQKKRSVPFRRYRKQIGHRSDLQNWDAGRYPVKAAQGILKVLENLENNAIFKGLDVPKLRLIHIVSQRARKIKGIMPRAQGRSSPSVKTLTHIEVVAEEE